MKASVEPSTAAAKTQDRRRAQAGTLGLERIAPAPHGNASGLLNHVLELDRIEGNAPERIVLPRR
ncbi:MAG: hypothetical protein ACYDAE_15465 [Steroidobacteraceae bacterium]